MYTNLPSQFPAKKEVGYATPQNQHLRNLKPPKCTTGIHLKGPIEVYGPIVLGTSNTICVSNRCINSGFVSLVSSCESQRYLEGFRAQIGPHVACNMCTTMMSGSKLLAICNEVGKGSHTQNQPYN